jgi:8-oxo-dGTP pyrophosphatase MutT (NUDIX family)
VSKKKRKRRVDYWQDPDAPDATTRHPSASALVRSQDGGVLLLLRPDNDLWTIPTGGLKPGETASECAVRECEEETGLVIEITGLVGVFTTPEHVIAYMKGDKITDVRQPVNICFHAHAVRGHLTTTDEAADVRWVHPADLGDYPIHPAIRRRIDHGLNDRAPHAD